MKYAIPVTIASDMSEAALQDAIGQMVDKGNLHLIVGTEALFTARMVKHKFDIKAIFVNPDWTCEWMVCGRWSRVFSEGVK